MFKRKSTIVIVLAIALILTISFEMIFKNYLNYNDVMAIIFGFFYFELFTFMIIDLINICYYKKYQLYHMYSFASKLSTFMVVFHVSFLIANFTSAEVTFSTKVSNIFLLITTGVVARLFGKFAQEEWEKIDDNSK